jgi:hypothetical protein
MKTRFIYFVICLILVNCKPPQPELNFKYSKNSVVITCNSENDKFFNEAFYNFEAMLNEHYANKNKNLRNAYLLFLKESTSNKVNYNNISDQHSIDIFEALKSIKGLWVENNSNLTLNYTHEIFSCIGENIQDRDLKTTYNALLSTNSMSIRMLKDVLISKSSKVNTDKYLATFVALELYYSKLSNVDLALKEVKSSEPEVKEETDSHAGHNHD